MYHELYSTRIPFFLIQSKVEILFRSTENSNYMEVSIKIFNSQKIVSFFYLYKSLRALKKRFYKEVYPRDVSFKQPKHMLL